MFGIALGIAIAVPVVTGFAKQPTSQKSKMNMTEQMTDIVSVEHKQVVINEKRCACVRCSWCESHSPKDYGLDESSVSEKTWINELLCSKLEVKKNVTIILELYLPKVLATIIVMDFLPLDLKCKFCGLSTQLQTPVFSRSLIGHWVDWLKEVGYLKWRYVQTTMTPSSQCCDAFPLRDLVAPQRCITYVWEVNNRIFGIPTMDELIEVGYLDRELVQLYRTHPNKTHLDKIMQRIFTLSNFFHRTGATGPIL